MLTRAIPGLAQSQQGNVDSASRLGRSNADIVVFPFTVNTDYGGGNNGEGLRTELAVNPALVFTLPHGLNIISNTQIPIRHSDQILPQSITGMGDLIQNTWLSPSNRSGTATTKQKRATSWGLGAVLVAPAAVPSALGQKQWGAGPSGFVTQRNGALTIGLVANQTSAFAGFRPDRPDVNRTYIYPFMSYVLRSKTALNASADATYDWTAKQWYVPVTISASQPITSGKQLISVGAGIRSFAGGRTGKPYIGAQVYLTYFWARR